MASRKNEQPVSYGSPQTHLADGRDRKLIIFLERQADYSFLFDYMKNNDEAANAYIYFPYTNLMSQLILAADKAGLEIEDQLLPYSTISLDYDNEIYKAALRFSEVYIDSIRLNSNRIYGTRDQFVPLSSKRAATIRLHDQVVSRLRFFYELNQHLKKYRPGKIIYAPSKGQPAQIVKNLLEKICGDCDVTMLTDHLLVPHDIDPLFMSTKASAFCAKRPLRLPSLADNKVRIPRGALSFVVNSIDKQYGHTLKPMLPILLEKETSCAVFNFMSGHTPDWLESEELKPHLKTRRLVYYQKQPDRPALHYTQKERRLMEASASHFEHVIQSQFEPELKIYASMISAYIAGFGFSLISLIKEYTQFFTPIIKRSSALVLMPGRALEAGIATGIAVERKVPNIEIIGILSKTNRYVTPIAQEAFCIEPYSASVLTDFLDMPKESVKVTGGVKIEYGLSSARKLSQADARSQIPEFQNILDQKILMLASQPIDISYASQIAEMAILACKTAGDINLVIKLHPNETDTRESVYAALAKKHNFTRLIVLKNTPVMNVVVACDIMSTYFSTVGLEAFALKRPVICLNPFQDTVPFDLVEMGVAAEAKSATELLQKIKDILSNSNDTLAYHPLLEAVRDGKAIERVTDMLASRSQAQRDLVSPLRLTYYKRKARMAKIRLFGGR